ncbi:7189_t:CDS:1, partial [Entrophospora sp. SA101]
ELEMKRLHYRKNIDKDWFSKYTWLESEENNQKILIFCKLCRNINGTSKFSKGTNVFRLDKIEKHSNTNKHKESELMLLNSYQTESNRDNTEQ